MKYTYMCISVITKCSIVHTMHKFYVRHIQIDRNLESIPDQEFSNMLSLQRPVKTDPTRTDYGEMMTKFTEVSLMEPWNTMTILFE